MLMKLIISIIILFFCLDYAMIFIIWIDLYQCCAVKFDAPMRLKDER